MSQGAICIRESRSRRPHHLLGASLVALVAACSSAGTEGSGGGGGGGTLPNPGGGGIGKPLSLTPRFKVDNDHANQRLETIRVSVPFAEGMVQSLGNVGVSGYATAWLPLQYWPDGTVKVAQAQFLDDIEGTSQKEYEVVQGVQALTGTFEQHPWIVSKWPSMEIGARVLDTFDHPYEAKISGAGEILQSTELVRVRRWRLYNESTSGGGIGRDYLSSTFYVTEFKNQPFLIVDWLLGNDYVGADDTTGKTDPNYFPLGPVDVNKAEFFVSGVAASQSYLRAKHGIASYYRENGRDYRTTMTNTFVADGQSRRYRFFLRCEDSSAPQATKDRWVTTFAAAYTPIRAMTELESWRLSWALGVHGGPTTGPKDAKSRAAQEYSYWDGANHFGTWGSFGDAKGSATTGTPRNGPMTEALAHAVQSDNSKLLTMLEQMAWAQAQRNYHLYGLKVGAEQNIHLWDGVPFHNKSMRDLSPESLGRRGLYSGTDPYSTYRSRVVWEDTAHGWNWFDTEHWSTDLLFDYYTISADAWALEEMRQLGQVMRGLFHYHNFNTSGIQAVRAEGWSMQSFVQLYLVLQDESLKQYALKRLYEVVEKQRQKNHPSKALSFQGTYPGTGFGGSSHRFFMLWQHGALLYGYMAAYKFFEEPLCLEICEDVVDTLEYSWVRNYQDPSLGFLENGIRYYTLVEFEGTPVAANHLDSQNPIRWGSSPLGGANAIMIGGMTLLDFYSSNQALRLRIQGYLSFMYDKSDSGRWNHWNYCVVE